MDKAVYLLIIPILLFVTVGCSPVASSSGEPMLVLYVDVHGDDNNPGTLERPFATLTRARNEVRKHNKNMTGDIIVYIGAGQYFITETIQFTTADSGTNGYNVIYKNRDEIGSAQLIGGELLKGWEPHTGQIYKAYAGTDQEETEAQRKLRLMLQTRGTLAPWVFHTLYENGIRARKARYPNYAYDERFPLSNAPYLTSEAGTETVLTYKPGDLTPDLWTLTSYANLVVWPWGKCDWQKATRTIQFIDATNRTISIHQPVLGGVTIDKDARYYVEGIFELLDQPGEFFYDLETDYVYYWPRFGDPNEQQIVVPRVKRIISIEGRSAQEPVRNLVFEGLTLGYTDTFQAMEDSEHFAWRSTYARHGVIHMKYTEQVQVRFNHIVNAGLVGIFLDTSNKYNTIYGNWIEGMGISGIVLGATHSRISYPQDRNEFNLISNNLIHRLGEISVDSAGINVWTGNDNIISHSVIFDGARYGVSLRGNYAQYTHEDNGRPYTENNRVEYIHLYRLVQDSGDAGALHTAGISNPEAVHTNYFNQILIENIHAHPSMQDLAPNGIFFDYPSGSIQQDLRNIEIRDTQGDPFRTNRTDIGHYFENCSWRPGFDPSRMEYHLIGLKDDFPQEYGPPEELTNVLIVDESRRDGTRTLFLSWDEPAGLAGVWIYAEGDPSVPPVYVPAGEKVGVISGLKVGEEMMLRLRTVDSYGNQSVGLLIPAVAIPKVVQSPTLTSGDGTLTVSWQEPVGRAQAVLVRVPGVYDEPLQVAPDVGQVELTGLENYVRYEIELSVLDPDGFIWPGITLGGIPLAKLSIPEDPIGHWRFESAEGVRFFDSTGRIVGTLRGEASWAENGVLGDALRLDGESGYAQIQDQGALSVGTGDFAISLWLWRDSSPVGNARVVDNGAMDDSTPGYCIFTGDRNLRFALGNGNERLFLDAAFDLVDRWTHVVVNIKRESVMELFINGQLVDATDVTKFLGQDLTYPGNLYLGRIRSSDGLYWPGYIDEMRLFNRALSPDEIASLYLEPTMDR